MNATDGYDVKMKNIQPEKSQYVTQIMSIKNMETTTYRDEVSQQLTGFNIERNRIAASHGPHTYNPLQICRM